MAYEIYIGGAILLAAVVIAWLLARQSHKGARKGDINCPHCERKIPRESAVCPHCSKPLHRCGTCDAYILDENGTCEVCGEAVSRRPPRIYRCPKCGAVVESRARKCPKCKEEFWSPVVSEH